MSNSEGSRREEEGQVVTSKAVVNHKRQLVVSHERWGRFMADLESDAPIESLVELFRNEEL